MTKIEYKHIPVRKETKLKLDTFGVKNESYDSLIVKLMEVYENEM